MFIVVEQAREADSQSDGSDAAESLRALCGAMR